MFSTMQYTTQQLIQWDRDHVWHPFTPMKAWRENKDIVVIERGEREFLIDTTGRRYIDGTSSIWCNVHGHHVSEIDAAVRDQLDKVAHSTLLGLSNVPSIVLARRLVELAAAQRPGGAAMELPHVFYSDNGSTAVEVACKMAFAYWRNVGHAAPGHGAKNGLPPRSRFIAFENSYHGDTLGAVSIGGIPAFHELFKPLCFATDFVPVGEQAAARIEQLIAADPHAYAAVVIEPIIQGAGGMVVHAPGTLQRIREICARHDVLLIADEVMTGFGRTGKMFACEHESVTPDFLCLSKGLTGGYMPLGVTMTQRKIFDAFYADPREGKTFFHGHTYTGHPLACAAALASLELFEKNRLLEHVQALEQVMAGILNQARGKAFVHEVRQAGLIGAIELRHRDGTPFPYHWRVGGAVCRALRDVQPVGLLMRPLADVVVIMPPLAIARENLDYLGRAVLQGLESVEEIVANLQKSS
jgi:adenosylmethionine-8-amino-7-oxononanoate aminotransferase